MIRSGWTVDCYVRGRTILLPALRAICVGQMGLGLRSENPC